jgi:hypothetical protein
MRGEIGERRAVNTAILFFTHVFDATTLRQCSKLSDEASPFGDVFFLVDSCSAPPDLPLPSYVFDFSSFPRKYPGLLGHALVPGNCHLPAAEFLEAHPHYDHYWLVEYDVRFSGSWRAFFSAFTDNTSDLLATHIRRFPDEPGWEWWASFQAHPSHRIERRELVKALLPVYRISRRALRHVARLAREGWAGHAEVLLPTVLSVDGFRIEDIGREGPFVDRARPKGFYTRSSFRWRPLHATWGWRRNVLYHPVKPDTPVVRQALDNAVALILGSYERLRDRRPCVWIRPPFRLLRRAVTHRRHAPESRPDGIRTRHIA